VTIDGIHVHLLARRYTSIATLPVSDIYERAPVILRCRGKRCNVCRNTASKYWKKGLKEEVFFPPQIRLKRYENRKEYSYLIQKDTP